MQQDPTGLQAGPNAYEFVGDGPTNGTDPSGKDSIELAASNNATGSQDVFWKTKHGTSITIGTYSNGKYSLSPNIASAFGSPIASLAGLNGYAQTIDLGPNEGAAALAERIAWLRAWRIEQAAKRTQAAIQAQEEAPGKELTLGEQLEGDISSIWNVFTGNTDEATARITAKAEANSAPQGRALLRFRLHRRRIGSLWGESSTHRMKSSLTQPRMCIRTLIPRWSSPSNRTKVNPIRSR